MNGPSKEVLMELAFALAEGAPLDDTMTAAAESAKGSREAKAVLDDYVRIIETARKACATSRAASDIPEVLDDNLIAQYVDGCLDPAARAEAEAVLARDPESLRAAVELAGLVREAADPGPSLIEYVIGVASKGIRMLRHPETGFAFETPAPVPVLGGGPASPTRESGALTRRDEDEARVKEQPSFTWIQFASNLRMTLTATHAAQERVDLTLRVNDTAGPLRGGRLTIRCNAKLVQSELLPADGTLSLRGLESAAYDFEIVPPGGFPVRFAVRLSAAT